MFARFDILEGVDLPNNWRWTKPIGNSEQLYLWQQYVTEPPKRISRIHDLKKVFTKTETLEFLDEIENLLIGLSEVEGPIEEGMNFDHTLRKILTAIRTKPFIMLAGMSGTGKSRLVRTLAFQTCNTAHLKLNSQKPGNFELITVKPNWHDSTELLGYVSYITDPPTYRATDFLKFIVKAWQNPDTPFFLCLDEMNLAPVEQYFAEYLSLIETRSVSDEKISTDPILKAGNTKSIFERLLTELGLSNSSDLWKPFLDNGISIPPNLVVMGTVNMDETTHSFSRKVLDRAMTIEINNVDLFSGLESEDQDLQYTNSPIPSDWVLGNYTAGGQVYEEFEEGKDVVNYLQNINRILEGSPFKIAYRVRDEFLIYCYETKSKCSNLKSGWLNKCIDELTVMKILSRIEGDEVRTSAILTQLSSEFETKYPASFAKIKEMRNKLEQTGYTSFWS